MATSTTFRSPGRNSVRWIMHRMGKSAGNRIIIWWWKITVSCSYFFFKNIFPLLQAVSIEVLPEMLPRPLESIAGLWRRSLLAGTGLLFAGHNCDFPVKFLDPWRITFWMETGLATSEIDICTGHAMTSRGFEPWLGVRWNAGGEAFGRRH